MVEAKATPSPRRSTEPAKAPRIYKRACVHCRNKKIRCNGGQPQCSACKGQKRECSYLIETPRKRFVAHPRSASLPEYLTDLIKANVFSDSRA